jgi:predicted GNAT family acetyltransferase
MRTLLHDPDGDLTVVENDDLRRYELRRAGTTVGTLDFRALGPQRILGHTEITVDHRGRGHGTTLIRAVLDDLVATGVRVTNYCPVVERFLQDRPEYVVVLNSPLDAAADAPETGRPTPLRRLVQVQHSRLWALAEQARAPGIDGFDRRRIADHFTAVAAQHSAAAADTLLSAARSHSDEQAAELLDNLKQFEQSLRVLKGRAYGDARFLGLTTVETWNQAERLLAEHELLEERILDGLEQRHGTEHTVDLARALARRQWSSPTRPHPNSPHEGLPGRIARRLWRIADTTWDQLEGRGLPTEPIDHPNQHSALSHYLFGTPGHADGTTRPPHS